MTGSGRAIFGASARQRLVDRVRKRRPRKRRPRKRATQRQSDGGHRVAGRRNDARKDAESAEPEGGWSGGILAPWRPWREKGSDPAASPPASPEVRKSARGGGQAPFSAADSGKTSQSPRAASATSCLTSGGVADFRGSLRRYVASAHNPFVYVVLRDSGCPDGGFRKAGSSDKALT